MFYKAFIRPVLFGLSKSDPEIAHERTLRLLALAGESHFALRALERSLVLRDPRLEQKLFGLTFPNPVGLAAGVDKNCAALRAFAALGFGFLEGGTATRHKQEGNPRPRIFRFPGSRALINRMGFNNEGADAVAKRLSRKGTVPVPLGLSIGKSKITPLEDATSDYCYSLKVLYSYGDYFVVNVSSPNTPGLRKLQDPDHLDALLRELKRQSRTLAPGDGRPKPLLVKISPDLSWGALNEVLAICRDAEADGIIAVNTTLSREGLRVPTREEGGLSGMPLKNRAREIVRYIRDRMPQDFPIIGVGGIFTADDAWRMFQAGANLIQIYTGFIYEGPFLPHKLNKELLRLMEERGKEHISELHPTKRKAGLEL